MIIFEFSSDAGDFRDITWLGSTHLTGADRLEADNIFEQLTAHEAHLDEEGLE